MPPTQSEGSGTSGSGATGGIKAAISAISQLASKAIEPGSPLSGKIFVLAITGVLFALPVGGMFVYKNHADYAMWLCGGVFGLLLIAILMFGFYYRESDAMQSLPAPMKEWGRKVPNYKEFPDEALKELGIQLEKVRQEALKFLRQHHPSGIKNEEVRAAIFLPHFKAVEEAAGCSLFIPDDLRKQLRRKEEWDLELRPGEGVSGDVFLNSKERIEPRVFKLPDLAKQSVLDPELKWIVGLPLKNQGTTMGALNVDGLIECKDELLSDMLDEIKPHVETIAQRLAQLPQARINIRVDQLRVGKKTGPQSDRRTTQNQVSAS